jgi:hypothetical protein
MQGLTLTRRSRARAVGPSIGPSERLRVCQVRVEGQPQRGAVLHEADPGMPMAVHAAFVPCGLSKPALQVEGILGQVRLFTPTKPPRGTAGHARPPGVPGRIIARAALLLHDLQRGLTLGTRATGWIERRLDHPDVLHGVAQGLVGVVDRRQPPVARARETPEALGRQPPVCAPRCRWSEACPSPQASAMRSPGGGRSAPTSRAIVRHPRMVRRIGTCARLSAASPGVATSRQQ